MVDAPDTTDDGARVRSCYPQAIVVSARGLVSSKGEIALSSSASLAFLNSDVVDSELVADTCEPVFDLSTSSLFHADDKSVEFLLTTPLCVSIFEGKKAACRCPVSLHNFVPHQPPSASPRTYTPHTSLYRAGQGATWQGHSITAALDASCWYAGSMGASSVF